MSRRNHRGPSGHDWRASGLGLLPIAYRSRQGVVKIGRECCYGDKCKFLQFAHSFVSTHDGPCRRHAANPDQLYHLSAMDRSFGNLSGPEYNLAQRLALSRAGRMRPLSGLKFFGRSLSGVSILVLLCTAFAASSSAAEPRVLGHYLNINVNPTLTWNR